MAKKGLQRIPEQNRTPTKGDWLGYPTGEELLDMNRYEVWSNPSLVLTGTTRLCKRPLMKS